MSHIQALQDPPHASAMRRVALSLLIAGAASLPFLLGSYEVFQLTMVMIYAIALLGLNILTGYNGQVSVGHGAFYAVGAYVAAVLIGMGLPYWLTLPVAGAFGFTIGFLFGLPALRLTGLYLALATFALGTALPQILKFKHFEGWTGGAHGIVLTPPEVPFGLPVSLDQWLYLLALAVTILMFWLGANLIGGRIGRALVAVRDQPVAAEAMGINTALVKAITFGVSAMFTGIAGALGAITVQFVAPESFTIFLSISFLVGVIVGGVSTLSGAIYGAFFIQFIPNVAGSISEGAPWSIYGIALILLAFFAPRGIAGAVESILKGLQRGLVSMSKKSSNGEY